MSGQERRRALLERLTHSHPAAGHDLAAALAVSRQVIVQDIAILRASGHPIISTPRGYLLWEAPPHGMRALIAVRHGAELDVVRQELLTMVQCRVHIINVQVSHPLYGELTGNLNLQTAQDVENFCQELKTGQAALLSSLTDGVHLHAIEGTPQAIECVRKQLASQGFLLSESS
ncbi:MAG: transcription repressor NadR [Firmicutes bacterium]|nr:transcription repressor NadR [Bacillota bacterium]